MILDETAAVGARPQSGAGVAGGASAASAAGSGPSHDVASTHEPNAAANSEVPGWAPSLVPIAWPRLVRVGWWLAVAVAAGAYRILLGRAGLPQSPWLSAASVAPFILFAGGIAAGAEWATWH